jgi:glutamate racemase
MKIAIYDSGMGGLTVLQEALRQLPEEQFIYFADTKNVPYGTKSREEVQQCILESVSSIAKEPLKALVVACNTATSIGIQQLRERCDFPVIGMEPAVKPAIALAQPHGKRVLVLATPLTLAESKYRDLVSKIDDYGIVDSLSMPELVPICEMLDFDGQRIQAYLRERFASLRTEEYGTVVLGCTHFPFFRRELSEWFAEDTKMIDGAQGTVRRMMEVIGYSQNASTVFDSETRIRDSDRVDYRCSGMDKQYVRKLRKALELLSGR